MRRSLERMALPAACDVCVVGAGIAGCAVAYHLRRSGVVVLEQARQHAPPALTSCQT